MSKKLILLGNVDAARALVSTAESCDFDIDLDYGNIRVDAKSIIGVLSLDLRKPWNISYDGTNDALEGFINEHLAAS